MYAAGYPLLFPCFTKSWLANNGIRVMEWPAQSPDMDPIESFWAIIKNA